MRPFIEPLQKKTRGSVFSLIRLDLGRVDHLKNNSNPVFLTAGVRNVKYRPNHFT